MSVCVHRYRSPCAFGFVPAIRLVSNEASGKRKGSFVRADSYTAKATSSDVLASSGKTSASESGDAPRRAAIKCSYIKACSLMSAVGSMGSGRSSECQR
ncbi:hypothetical protein B1A99_02115 [Cohnella sp. CIP 111063]|nr:hypothetical protein B1A99_02115 [Cohnella sp. CIP 111063]